MPQERSAGAVIFKKNKEIHYLVLHYELGHWDFVKGHIEDSEDIKATIVREAEEEAGIRDLDFVEGFEEKIEYFFKREGRTVFKRVFFLLAETKTKEVKLSCEHVAFKWLSYGDALKQLTFENARKLLEKANKFLISNSLL